MHKIELGRPITRADAILAANELMRVYIGWDGGGYYQTLSMLKRKACVMRTGPDYSGECVRISFSVGDEQDNGEILFSYPTKEEDLGKITGEFRKRFDVDSMLPVSDGW